MEGPEADEADGEEAEDEVGEGHAELLCEVDLGDLWKRIKGERTGA